MNSVSAEDAGQASMSVDPTLVHKRTASNSWLTSYRVREANEMDASFLLSRSVDHPRLSAFMEVWRQSGLVFAHKVLHVPMDHVFSLTSVSLRMGDIGSLHRASRRGTVHISDCVVSGTRSAVRAASAAAKMSLDSGEMLEGRLSARFLSARTYARLRPASPPQISEGGSSKRRPKESETRTSGRAPELLADPFYDHENDHVTAMSLVAAIERVVVPASSAELSGIEFEFLAYIDAYPLPEISYVVSSDAQFRGVILQESRVKARFSGSIRPARPPATVGT